jgi:hypothetical protein
VLDQLRDRLITYLSQNQSCVLTTSGCQGAWAVPAPYENAGLELICRLPRWSDVVFHIEQDPEVLAIIQDASPLCWLQVRGTAQLGDSPEPGYVMVHITPQRIDLFDEGRGWGARETLDL